ncbi:MAG: hypothetical protein MUE54_08155 [Anaerolineae bacterium]|jgi:hypothetical protein|nr:hypothetical protein [Anaerolineae bacterium]
MGNNDRDFFDFDDDPFDDDGGSEGTKETPTNFGGDSDFSFEEETTQFEDFDEFGDFDDIEDDFTVEDEAEAQESGGPSRTFIILAALLVLLFLAGLVVVVILATRPRGPSAIDLTRTQIALENGQTLVAFNATNTAKAVDVTQTFEAAGTQSVLTATANANATSEAGTLQAMGATETAQFLTNEALSLAETQTAEFLLTQNALTPTFDFNAQQADILAATQTAQANNINATLTAIAGTNLPQTNNTIGDVALTATAIANALRNQPTAEAITPTGGAIVSRTPVPDPDMPDSGLFDDFAGGNNMALIALMAFGLIGIIFSARVLRESNNRKPTQK